MFPGIVMICKYFYWVSPANRQRYRERLENEQIELHDELKTKIRDRAGRCAYGAGLLILCFSILLFSILGALGLMDNARTMVLYLGAFLVFEIAAGVAIFRHLLRQYE